MKWLLLCCISTLYGSDTLVPLDIHDQSSEHSEIAHNILTSFLGEHHISDRTIEILCPYLAHRLEHENEEIRIVLSRSIRGIPIDIDGEIRDNLTDKLLELVADTIDKTLEEQERRSEEWEREANSRCRRITVGALSAMLSLLGIAVGAAVTAGVQAALD